MIAHECASRSLRTPERVNFLGKVLVKNLKAHAYIFLNPNTHLLIYKPEVNSSERKHQSLDGKFPPKASFASMINLKTIQTYPLGKGCENKSFTLSRVLALGWVLSCC
jgi:hypothetical protein